MTGPTQGERFCSPLIVIAGAAWLAAERSGKNFYWCFHACDIRDGTWLLKLSQFTPVAVVARQDGYVQ
jgi:hypothetical protein